MNTAPSPSQALLEAHQCRSKRELLDDMTRLFLRDEPGATAEEIEAYRRMTAAEIGLEQYRA